MALKTLQHGSAIIVQFHSTILSFTRCRSKAIEIKLNSPLEENTLVSIKKDLAVLAIMQEIWPKEFCMLIHQMISVLSQIDLSE